MIMASGALQFLARIDGRAVDKIAEHVNSTDPWDSPVVLDFTGLPYMPCPYQTAEGVSMTNTQ